MSLIADAKALHEQLIAWRRDFHAHPELGFQEKRTTDILAEFCGELGLEVTCPINQTGVMAVLDVPDAKRLVHNLPVGPRSSETAAGKAEEGGDSMERIVDRRERSQPSLQPTEARAGCETVSKQLWALLSPCAICPRDCNVFRRGGQTGFCGAPGDLIVASAGPHFGEEPVLVGNGGSGTIFLAGCNLRCIFCQNSGISHEIDGAAYTPESLAEMMLSLQRRGCVNVNFVTPTHYSPHIGQAIRLARDRGLSVPTVYNCGGYESVRTLELLEGLIDVYMPDVKFLDSGIAARLTGAPNYPEVVRAAIREMHRQVGDLIVTGGLATRGLLVRHLVMPNGESTSKDALNFLAKEISGNTFVNVMAQYRPCYQAGQDELIARRPSADEFTAAVTHARSLGLRLAR